MPTQSLHEILVDWQAGRIDYRCAMALAQIDTLGELYDAALHSGVPIRTEPTEHEARHADVVAELIRGQLRPPTKVC